jgi:hypothetical protein
MPVSKKRKKGGKPVRRERPAVVEGEPASTAMAPEVPAGRMGRPSNPFVALQQSRRASQRGR